MLKNLNDPNDTNNPTDKFQAFFKHRNTNSLATQLESFANGMKGLNDVPKNKAERKLYNVISEYVVDDINYDDIKSELKVDYSEADEREEFEDKTPLYLEDISSSDDSDDTDDTVYDDIDEPKVHYRINHRANRDPWGNYIPEDGLKSEFTNSIDYNKLTFLERATRYPDWNILDAPVFRKNNTNLFDENWYHAKHEHVVFSDGYRTLYYQLKANEENRIQSESINTIIDSNSKKKPTKSTKSKKSKQTKQTQQVKSQNLYTDLKEKGESIRALGDIDILITFSWSNEQDKNSISNDLYNAYELYRIIRYNCLPEDLGGKRIRLLIPEFNNGTNPFTGTLGTYLGANRNYGNEITKAIMTKYKGTKRETIELEHDLIFAWKPKSIILRKGTPPYVQNMPEGERYQPSSIVFVDGKLPKDAIIQADNVHLCLWNKGFQKEEITSNHHYNFLCLYMDPRMKQVIESYNGQVYNEESNILVYEQNPKICFDIILNGVSDTSSNIDHDPASCYMVYVPPGTRGANTMNGSKDTIFLDSILDSIDEKHLNPLAKKIQGIQKTTEKELIKSIMASDLSKEDKEIAIENLEDTLNSTVQQKITQEEILEELQNDFKDPDVIKPTILIVGLNELNRNFETSLLARAYQRGIAINIKTYLQKDLPITNLFKEFQTYIYTPNITISEDPLKNLLLDYDTRFIPECIWMKKKIKISSGIEEYYNAFYNKYTPINQREKMRKLNNSMIKGKYLDYHPLLGLSLRIKDTVDDFSVINESITKPTSLLVKHLLGEW